MGVNVLQEFGQERDDDQEEGDQKILVYPANESPGNKEYQVEGLELIEKAADKYFLPFVGTIQFPYFYQSLSYFFASGFNYYNIFSQ